MKKLFPDPQVKKNKVSVVDFDLEKIDARLLKALKINKGKPAEIAYVIDFNDNVFVSSANFPEEWLPQSGTPLILRNSSLKEGPAGAIPKEIGNLSWNEQTKKFEFKPKYNQEYKEGLKAHSSVDVETASQTIPSQRHSRVVECLDIIAAQSRHGNFFMNNLLAGSAINVGAIGISELNQERHSAGRLRNKDGSFNPDGAYSIGNDIAVGLAGTIMGSAAATGIGRAGSLVPAKGLVQSILLKDALIGFGGRQLASQGIIWVNKNYIYQMLGSSKEKKSGALQKDAAAKANFDRKFYFTKSVWDALAVRGFMHTLPEYLYSSCTKGRVTKVVLSPGAIRVYEKAGMATLYYSLRKKAVDE